MREEWRAKCGGDKLFSGTRRGRARREVSSCSLSFGEPPVSPEDSSGSTFREWSDVRAGSSRPFPLTLTLSLREREQRAPRSESRKLWTVLRGEQGCPSPQGRGLGWEAGKETTARHG